MAERRIWVINRDGSNRRQLTQDNSYRDERPLWSIDGSHILFARLDGEDRASLWITSVAAQEPEKVADLNPCSRPPGSCQATNFGTIVQGSFWFGYYGYVQWNSLYSWWRGPS